MALALIKQSSGLRSGTEFPGAPDMGSDNVQRGTPWNPDTVARFNDRVIAHGSYLLAITVAELARVGWNSNRGLDRIR